MDENLIDLLRRAAAALRALGHAADHPAGADMADELARELSGAAFHLQETTQ
jgi:ribosomal protein S7